MYGIKAKIGLPPGIPPQRLPDIVNLGADTSSIIYNLMCLEFTVVEATYGRRGIVSWLNQSQPAGTAWLFTSKVDLRLSAADKSAYSQLPPAVQTQIKNMGSSAFSVQQLLFDLDNAALQSVPVISRVAPGTPLYMGLQQVFLGACFTTMQKNGKPVLGYAIKQSGPDPSSLALTGLDLEVNPFLGSDGQPVFNPTSDQQNFATLNYLCAVDGRALPVPSRFSWNWIEPADAAIAHGTVVINRNTLVEYFKDRLAAYVKPNCFNSNVRVWLSGFLDTTVNYSWSLSPYQNPSISAPPSGPLVLEYSYRSAASDDAGLGGDMGQMELYPQFDVEVTFSGNTITIVQHLVIYLHVRVMQTGDGGNIVDKTITDTYTLAVNPTGGLSATLSSSTSDSSQNPGTNGFLNFFTNLNDIINDVENWTRNFVSTRFTDIPVSAVQTFVFPGGKTFVFKDVAFSDNQDLVSHITYAQPAATVMKQTV